MPKEIAELRNVESNLIQIVMNLGCEELIKISEKDATYFGRVVFMLDGDARYKEPPLKPKVKDYLLSPYNATGISDRKHTPNICFLPNYFAPESYLYRIIFELTNHENDHTIFWRTLDQNEATALYTATKVREFFSNLPEEFTNDDLKRIFGEYHSDPAKKVQFGHLLIRLICSTITMVIVKQSRNFWISLRILNVHII